MQWAKLWVVMGWFVDNFSISGFTMTYPHFLHGLSTDSYIRYSSSVYPVSTWMSRL